MYFSLMANFWTCPVFFTQTLFNFLSKLSPILNGQSLKPFAGQVPVTSCKILAGVKVPVRLFITWTLQNSSSYIGKMISIKNSWYYDWIIIYADVSKQSVLTTNAIWWCTLMGTKLDWRQAGKFNQESILKQKNADCVSSIRCSVCFWPSWFISFHRNIDVQIISLIYFNYRVWNFI